MTREPTKSEPLLDRWRDDDVYVDDALFAHFTELLERGEFVTNQQQEEGLDTPWIKIADEGRRLWCRMFYEIKDGSPVAGMISAVSAAAFEAALRDVAARLGVTAHSIECVIEQAGPPDVEMFLRECREAEADHIAHEEERRSRRQASTPSDAQK